MRAHVHPADPCMRDAAQAFAAEYNEAVGELHSLTYAEVGPMEAEATLTRLQAVAARAAAAGAPDDLMGPAQVIACFIT